MDKYKEFINKYKNDFPSEVLEAVANYFNEATVDGLDILNKWNEREFIHDLCFQDLEKDKECIKALQKENLNDFIVLESDRYFITLLAV